eukprot:TRINITY_DN23734_c0_g1_i1.p1 TRINITY_DN23734_c0_g1~~TRINITY_DN23734_c0_g1_i1.p1  ORF type:complete len:1701 (+),score=258.19 TRINITY_DN23734_c0_g1_i1:23-5104(+)
MPSAAGHRTECWDVLTDAPRPESDESPQQLCFVPISPAEETDESSVLTVLAAVCAALCCADHGRSALWISDFRENHSGGLFKASFHASLSDLRDSLNEKHEANCAKSQVWLCASQMWQQQQAPNGGFASIPDFAVCVPSDRPGSWTLAYRADIYDESTAIVLARHSRQLLLRNSEWHNLQQGDVLQVCLSEAERTDLLKAWQGKEVADEAVDGIHKLFERCARGPWRERPAARGSGAVWSYSQLDAAAGEVAAALLALGVRPGGRVPILVRRDFAMLAAIYGVLRAGQAYVPLDVGWPPARQSLVIEDVAAEVLVLGQGFVLPPQCQGLSLLELALHEGHSKVPTIRVTVTAAAGAAAEMDNCNCIEDEQRSSSTVYILYTSGTTGKPKGVDVPHTGLIGRTEWLQRTWPLGAEDVMVQKTPISFAISEWELFWPLCYGAQLSLAADGLHGDAQHIAQLIADDKVSHSVFVPSLLEQLLDELNGKDLPSLKVILACGEPLKAGTAKLSCEVLSGTELVNLYGPTEGAMTLYRIPKSPTDKDLLRCPIGVPMENTLVYCTAGSLPDLALAPVLSKGELLFGGPLIATGYWGLPDLTKDKFVDNPHGEGRLYRTGDLGRWRSDGSLEFLGRADSQVKFNGIRIELGEIEAALLALPGLRSAVVFVCVPHLVATCCLLNQEGTPGHTQQQILEGLRARLPKDRIPTRIEVLESFPLTDRGKVDRKKLIDEFSSREQQRKSLTVSAGEISADNGPSTDTEQLVISIMRKVLGEDTMGVLLPVTETFQALGFSSLLLGKLTTHLRRASQQPGLAATAVFLYPTVRKLAAHLDEAKQANFESSGRQSYVVVPHVPAWRGGSPTSLLSLTCSIIGLMFQSVITEFSFLPAYYILFLLYFQTTTFVMLLAAGPILVLDEFLTLSFFVLLKWIIIGRRREGNYPVFGLFYWKWWLVHVVEHYVEEHVSCHLADTASYNWFLNSLGANIASDARLNHCHISDVDLITIEAEVRVEREATLCPSRFANGELQLRSIHIGQGARIAHRAVVACGGRIGSKMELSAMSSADPSGAHHVVPRRDGGAFTEQDEAELSRFQWQLGIPTLMVVEVLALIPTCIFLVAFWEYLVQNLVSTHSSSTEYHEQVSLHKHQWKSALTYGFNLEGKQRVLWPFCACLPWVMTFVHGGCNFCAVVLVKWLFVGRFKEGRPQTSWERFQRWLIERLTTSPTFDHFMQLWVNTELLSCCYRLLGARVAFRVNMDVFAAVEYDLIEIERDVVFGSSVFLVNTSSGVTRPIRIRRAACVLDHSCVLAGASIPEGALLGSFTVVAEDQKLEAMTVYTGSEKGASVRLFQRPLLPNERIEGERVVSSGPSSVSDKALLPAAAKQRSLEQQAMQCHESCFWFWLFNLWCVLSAVVFAPLPDVVYWMTILLDFLVYDYFKDSDTGEIAVVVMIAPLYAAITFGMLLIMSAFKWTLVGKWTVGDRPYYSWFHFRWAALMVAFTSLDDLQAAIAGTWFATAFMRLMGAKVGKQVCFFGHGFEYDLLHLGDNVCIGPDCDVTAHTVENMVMKMDEVRFERGSSCLTGSVVMPGGVMEAGSTLIDHSQVLKGDTVPEGTCFGGLPAKLLHGYSVLDPQPLQDEKRRQRSEERSLLGGDGGGDLDIELASLPSRARADLSDEGDFTAIYSDSESPKRKCPFPWMFGRLR